jgi:hypothetical protein
VSKSVSKSKSKRTKERSEREREEGVKRRQTDYDQERKIERARIYQERTGEKAKDEEQEPIVRKWEATERVRERERP